MKKLPMILLHTTSGNVDVFQDLLRETAPDVSARHVLRDDLLKAAFAAGKLTDAVRADTRDALIALAADDAGLVLCTCSTIGPGADDANAADGAGAAVLRIDRPMMEEALKVGPRIAVAATFSTTMEPTLDLLRKTAQAAGQSPDIQEFLFHEARPAFEAGDMEGYLDIIAAGLRGAAKGADVIVLAQASMAPALERTGELPIPVLSSPRSGLAQAVSVWRAQNS